MQQFQLTIDCTTSEVLDALKTHCPAFAQYVEQRLAHDPSWQGSLYIQLEWAADWCNQLMRRQQDHWIKHTFALMSCAYVRADLATKEAIDVGFVEHLFWQLPTAIKTNYWPLCPPVLQQLWIGFHGQQDWMR